jgi:hypothetical protein
MNDMENIDINIESIDFYQDQFEQFNINENFNINEKFQTD